MRYLSLFGLSAIASFGLVWAWVWLMPLAFMDAEYPSWRAKEIMLDRCDLGEAVILGDSRAAADILPNRLPLRTTNLAVGGGKAIEAVAALKRVLACHSPPKLVIISLDPGHFTRPDLFWDRSVRFGFVSSPDIADLRSASQQTADWQVYEQHPALPAIIRDLLYESRFPPLYFSSLAHGGGLLRWGRNAAMLEKTLASRGQYYFGTAEGSDGVAFDGHLDTFQPLPVLDHYFEQLLTMLDTQGIEAVFIAMPVNQTTWDAANPAVREQFEAYLANYERRFPHFHVVSDIMPHWPDRFFGDWFCHLNKEGAERFSALLAQRLQDAPPSTQNEAQKGWLSETGAAASASVVPISKRGS